MTWRAHIPLTLTWGVPGISRRGDNSQLTLPPEPSFNNSSEWVRWCAEQLETPTWWQELSEVPSQMDVQEFVRSVQALFQLPKASNHAPGVDNDYMVPPSPQSLNHDWFLPISNMRFGGQDYCMRQPQKTLAYAKALQYWAEKAQPAPLGRHHQMAESMLELQRTMEPLTMFTNAEVLENALPLH